MALRIGISINDLKDLNFSTLANIIWFYYPHKEEQTRKATQEDINAFLQ